MNFTSPDELAAHLATTIDDEAFILKAVRIKFPGWNGGDVRSDFTPIDQRPRPVKPPRDLANNYRYAQRNYARPADDGMWAAEQADKHFRQMIETGSTRLLCALHDSHPRIMQTLKERGRLVVQP